MTGGRAPRPAIRARWGPELAIVAFALALRLGLFLAVGAWDPARLERQIFVGDARDYHRLAVNLVDHGVYSSAREPPFEPNTFRVPLYPWYLALVYRLWGPLPHLAILPQLALGALTCGVVTRAGTLLFDRRTGIVAGSILALDYSSVLFSNRLYSDTLFTLLLALALYALSRFVVGDDGSGQRAAVIAAGFSLGLATLCRPVSLYFVVALAPVVWLRLRRRPGMALARSGLLVAVYLLTLAPWMARNFVVAGRPYVTSIQTWVDHWYLPAVAGTPGAGASDDARGSIRDDGEAGSGPRQNERPGGPAAAAPAQRSWSWPNLRSDARGFARGFVRYFAILGSGELPLILGIPYGRHDALALRDARLGEWIAATLRNRSSPLERSLVVSIAAYLGALYLAAALGLWVAARRSQWLQATLLLATIGYFMVATGPIAREIRYRLPALPAIVLFAAVGLASVRPPSPKRP